jgi:hypothetical protein
LCAISDDVGDGAFISHAFSMVINGHSVVLSTSYSATQGSESYRVTVATSDTPISFEGTCHIFPYILFSASFLTLCLQSLLLRRVFDRSRYAALNSCENEQRVSYRWFRSHILEKRFRGRVSPRIFGLGTGAACACAGYSGQRSCFADRRPSTLLHAKRNAGDRRVLPVAQLLFGVGISQSKGLVGLWTQRCAER